MSSFYEIVVNLQPKLFRLKSKINTERIFNMLNIMWGANNGAPYPYFKNYFEYFEKKTVIIS